MRVALAVLACVPILGCSRSGRPVATALHARADDPARAEQLYRQGLAVQKDGDKNRAIALFYRAVEADPDFAPVRNHLAWLRATDPDPAFRDGAEAVRLAEAACKVAVGKEASDFAANCLDTLAAAEARAGRFDDAVTSAARAVAMMELLGKPQAARAFRARQKMYLRKEPYEDR